MKIYDAATEYVKQGGKRRGANMGILNVDHPDIEEFIMSKSDKKSIENFNLSVGISNAFMKAVEDDSDWQLINPHTQKIAQIISAKSLWELMVQEAWKTVDPGLIFIDVINDSNTTPDLGRIQATNPCGEVPLRGTFPGWKLSTFGASNRKMRNATWNSIAPTGTISVIANTSYSIEPLFALAYRRVGILGGKIQTEINAVFIQKMKMLNLWNSPMKKIVWNLGI